MAVSRGFNQFADRMRVIGSVTEDNAQRAVMVASTGALEGAVRATPVDTAMAVSNWIVSLNATTREIIPPHVFRNGPSSGSQAISAGIPTIASFTLNAQNITITNSTPYIADLERGSSRQAPMGMLQFGVLGARNSLRNFRLLEGVR